MVLAFGAMDPLTVAAAALSHTVLVAAAGVVVVLAILLVFVMVLRGSGSSRQKKSGLDYDAQQGPLGQPHAPASESAQAGAPWPNSPMAQMSPMGQMDDRFDAMDQGFAPGMGQGRSVAQQAPAQPAWGASFGDAAPQANAAQWGAQDATGGHWNDQMTPAGGGGQMSGLNDWGATPGAGRAAANPWDAPAAAPSQPAWNAGPSMPPSRPSAANGANPWDAPAPAPAQAWDAPAQPTPWDAPAAAPSQPAWGGPPPAAPSQPAWGGPPPAAPSQPAWGGPPPAAPSQPSWSAQADAGMMRAAAPRGATSFAAPHLVERKTDGSGRDFDLSKERLTIGRHRDSDVFLEDLAVSRLHTTISRDASGRYILRDENSANGTYVNGQRVNEYVLNDGDEVQVGQTVLVFQQR